MLFVFSVTSNALIELKFILESPFIAFALLHDLEAHNMM